MKKIFLAILFLIVPISSYASTLDVGLHAFYNLNEFSGDRYDASGNAKTLTSNSVPSTTGKIDLGADYNGSNTYGIYRNDAGFIAGDDRSFSFWVYIRDANSGSSKYVFDAITTAGDNARAIVYYDSNTLHFFIDGNEVTSTITSNTWYHVVITANTSNQWVLHINGTEIGDTTKGALSYSGNSYRWGASLAGTTACDCIIDSAGIWNKVLTADEIDELYNGGAGQEYPFSATPPSPPAVSTTVTVAPVLYSSTLIQNPVSTSTYSFTSTQASSTLKQTGLVYIVHNATSTTPSVTWGGTSMTFIEDTDSLGGYKTSLFALRNPTNQGAVTVSGLVASSTKYISQSVWSNADIWPNFDQYTVVDGVSRASLSLNGTVAPVVPVVSMYSTTGLDGFSILPSTKLIQSATSSNILDFALLYSLCSDVLDDCSTGYTKDFSFSTKIGVLVGMSMYATSTRDTSSAPSLLEVAGRLGTEEGFAECLDDGFVGSIACLGKNMLFWVLNLFIPSTQEMENLKEVFYSTVTATSSLTSTVFLIPLQFAFWTSSSTVPEYTPFEIYVPVIDKSWDIVGNTNTTVDNAVYGMLSWMLGVITALFIGYRFFKLVH